MQKLLRIWEIFFEEYSIQWIFTLVLKAKSTIRSSLANAGIESPKFLRIIYGDVWGFIAIYVDHLDFTYLIEISTSWLYRVYYIFTTWSLQDYLIKI